MATSHSTDVTLRMRKALKLVGFLSAMLVLFFIVASLAFYHLVRIGEVRRFLVDEIEKQTDLYIGNTNQSAVPNSYLRVRV